MNPGEGEKVCVCEGGGGGEGVVLYANTSVMGRGANEVTNQSPPSICQNYLQKILCVSVEMIYFHFENEINSCQNLARPPPNEKITNQKMSRVLFKLIIV